MEKGRRVVSGGTPHGGDGTMRKGRKGRKNDDGLSIPRIIGMFVASVTVSAITTKLTSYLGSVIIVGLSSVLLAVFNALYERFFKASRRAAAKAILNMPHNEALPDKVAGHLQEIVIEDAVTDITGMRHTVDADGEGVDGGRDVRDGTDAAASDGTKEDADGGTDGNGRVEGRWKVRNIFGSMSTTMKTVIIILLFALTTSLISWGVTTVVEKPDVTNVTVKESKVEKLSQEEKDAIKSAAAAEVSSQIKQAQTSADAANGSTSDLDKRVASLEKRTSDMQTTLNSMQTQNGPGQQGASASDITALRQQLSQMREEIDTLKSQQSSPSPSNRGGTGGTMNNGNANH